MTKRPLQCSDGGSRFNKDTGFTNGVGEGLLMAVKIITAPFRSFFRSCSPAQLSPAQICFK